VIGALGNRAGIILSMVTVVSALLAPRPAGINSAPTLDEAELLSLPAMIADSGYTVQGEYLPVTSDPGSIAAAIMAAPVGSVGIEVIEWSGGHHKRAVVAATKSGDVALPLVAYPFYKFQIEGLEISPRDQAGRWTVPVDVGDHVLIVERRLTTAQISSLGLTGVGLVILAYMSSAAARHRSDARLDASEHGLQART
jgi:hypothetical protein